MNIPDNLKFMGVSPYIFWAIIGCVFALAVFLFHIKRNGMTPRLPLFLIFSSFLGASPGARVFAYIASKIYYANTGKESYGGLVFYGGLFGFLTVFYLFQKITVNSQNKILWDGAALAIPLFHAFGRIGCAFSGCCFGIEFDKFYIAYSDGIRRFPVQLLEASFELLLFLVLMIFACKRKHRGSLIKIYLITYSVLRFFLEFLRGDEIRGMIGCLSFSQVCSIAVFAGMIIHLLKRRSDT